MLYRFTDSDGNEYYCSFPTREAAAHFAYVFGLCFMGRVYEPPPQ